MKSKTLDKRGAFEQWRSEQPEFLAADIAVASVKQVSQQTQILESAVQVVFNRDRNGFRLPGKTVLLRAGFPLDNPIEQGCRCKQTDYAHKQSRHGQGKAGD
ncbi:hypothetical protein [Lacisediminimonas sp.]|uniref:hypothetical protein n=1 Tax=Lacisediminimonas sp. TaxID=3060582 RepID=UPI002718A340|nr:hypothetical protein [Lacisediminimonas sp.]MDO8301548.1 hypothetical protein [Lacisediminimonas sp.]